MIIVVIRHLHEELRGGFKLLEDRFFEQKMSEIEEIDYLWDFYQALVFRLADFPARARSLY